MQASLRQRRDQYLPSKGPERGHCRFTGTMSPTTAIPFAGVRCLPAHRCVTADYNDGCACPPNPWAQSGKPYRLGPRDDAPWLQMRNKLTCLRSKAINRASRLSWGARNRRSRRNVNMRIGLCSHRSWLSVHFGSSFRSLSRPLLYSSVLRSLAQIKFGVLLSQPFSPSLRVCHSGCNGWPYALMPLQCGGMAFLEVVWTHCICQIFNRFRCRRTNTKRWLVIDCHGCR